VPSSAKALRSLVWSRSAWISAGGSHDSGSISFANNKHSQRASSRSVFAPPDPAAQRLRLRRVDQAHVEAAPA
jgi:hypothetical protein